VRLKHRLEDGQWASVLQQVLKLALSSDIEFYRQSCWLPVIGTIIASRKGKADPRVHDLRFMLRVSSVPRVTPCLL
jgi:hypothetical protein